MPNHITNIVVCKNEKFKTYLEECKQQNSFQFNDIIPAPDCFDITAGVTCRVDDAVKAGDISVVEERHLPEYHRGVKSLQLTGYSNKLEWNIANWGCKWSAYEVEINPDTYTIKFLTPWIVPIPIIEALSKRYPDTNLVITHADEDLGVNCGESTLLNGNVIKTTQYTSENIARSIINFNIKE